RRFPAGSRPGVEITPGAYRSIPPNSLRRRGAISRRETDSIASGLWAGGEFGADYYGRFDGRGIRERPRGPASRLHPPIRLDPPTFRSVCCFHAGRVAPGVV